MSPLLAALGFAALALHSLLALRFKRCTAPLEVSVFEWRLFRVTHVASVLSAAALVLFALGVL